jgi:4-hydroxy-tetrahydrodipicolinate synthase
MDSASEIRQRCGITILSGDDTLTLAFAAVGAVGVVSVLSNIVPDRVSRLCSLAQSNDFAAARVEHASLFALARGLLTIDTNPAPIKAAMQVLGRDSGVLRLPMCALPATGLARVRDLLRAVGLEPAADFAGAIQ